MGSMLVKVVLTCTIGTHYESLMHACPPVLCLFAFHLSSATDKHVQMRTIGSGAALSAPYTIRHRYPGCLFAESLLVRCTNFLELLSAGGCLLIIIALLLLRGRDGGDSETRNEVAFENPMYSSTEPTAAAAPADNSDLYKDVVFDDYDEGAYDGAADGYLDVDGDDDI
eukprot:m.29210 g.29210  ORF g.29210 m.29210 type:complete len:169 (+) comp13698_c0_seq1:57-563(+)